CREFLSFLGHNGHQIGLHLKRGAYHFICCSHLQVQFAVHCLPQKPHVPLMYMPLVFPQVNSYPVSSSQQGKCCSHNRIGFESFPCLSDCGHMVNINSEQHMYTS